MYSQHSLAALILAGILTVPGLAQAQSSGDLPPHVPLQKTIGQGKSTVVPSLIVMNSQSATLEGNVLTLRGIAQSSIVFADRPVRAAGHAPTTVLLEEWSPSNTDTDSFAKNPPNATVSAFSADGLGVQDAVVVLKSPKQEGADVTFEVEVLEGELTGADGAAAVFIDIIGRPLTPLSYAGVARRTVRRGAFYAGAAATAGAAAAAAAPPCY